MENLYKVLGVADFASEEEIKKAYREKIKIYHPDNIETGDIEKFRKLDEQYRILANPETRADYDSKLKFEQDFEKKQQDSKMFHFNDTYDEERVRAKKAQFQNEYYGKSSNWGSDYYNDFLKNMFGFNTASQNDLSNRRDEIKRQIEERKSFLRVDVIRNNPYEEIEAEKRRILDDILNRFQELKKNESNKEKELISLRNRKMYQMSPSRFVDVENILQSELKKLRVERRKLEIQLEVKKSDLKGLEKMQFDYIHDKVYKSDIELIQLKSDLRKVELQINFPETYTNEVECMVDELCKLQVLIAKREIEIQKYSKQNDPYSNEMLKVGESIVELEIKIDELNNEIQVRGQESLNLRNNVMKNIVNSDKFRSEVDALADITHNLQSELDKVIKQKNQKQGQYNEFSTNCSENSFTEECLKTDIQLIQYKEQKEILIEQIKQLLNNHYRK